MTRFFRIRDYDSVSLCHEFRDNQQDLDLYEVKARESHYEVRFTTGRAIMG